MISVASTSLGKHLCLKSREKSMGMAKGKEAEVKETGIEAEAEETGIEVVAEIGVDPAEIEIEVVAGIGVDPAEIEIEVVAETGVNPAEIEVVAEIGVDPAEIEIKGSFHIRLATTRLRKESAAIADFFHFKCDLVTTQRLNNKKTGCEKM